ncbi:MAG TPA: hypothetical protein VHY56_09585 [Candidatus Binataceae bacterium]|nr:hypothetical protein [Candidatus Binataceae bacterium]
MQGRGIVLLPQLRPVGEERFRVGDPLALKRPDGIEGRVHIAGLELLKPLEGNCLLVVMLSEKSKEDVPIGTEVWSVETPQTNPEHFRPPA